MHAIGGDDLCAIRDALPARGAIVGGHYRVEHPIGGGGMGVVLAATHLRTGRAVAIKWMRSPGDPIAVARFLAEARLTARIEHPNVVHVYDLGEEDGTPFLVMERLRGETLRERLRREGRLPPAEVRRIAAPVLRGVAEAHREGVLHRDLKPDNVFLCVGKDGREREPKVLDFGIGKLREDRSRLTRAGMVVGTPAYMAPEVLAGASPDARADVYALGVVLYEALAGRCPHEADGTYALVALIATRPAPPLRTFAPDVPPALAAIVDRALARDPSARFPSAQAMLDALSQLDAPAEPRAIAPTIVMPRVAPPDPPPPPRPSRARGTFATVYALSASLALAAWVAVGGPEPIERLLGDLLDAPIEAGEVRAQAPVPVAVPAPVRTEPVAAPEPPALEAPVEPERERAAEPPEPDVVGTPDPAPRRAARRAREQGPAPVTRGTNGALILR